MNVKYLRAQATARKLIRENGAKFPWRRVTKVRDPIEETEVEEIETQDVWAVVLPPNSGSFLERMDQFFGNNATLNLSKNRRVLVSTEGLTFNPIALDQIFHQGEWWIFENSSELAPDGETNIMFKGSIRRL